MDSSIELKVQEALKALHDVDVSFMLIVEDTQGAAVFSNSKGSRLYIVNKEE
tara:strand:+ start:624 stop:779 length:156 start_codon:yes stop_codon:yes gene_type:complete